MVVLFLSFSAPSTVVCTFRMHSQHVHLSPVLLSTSESKTLSSLIWVNWFSCCYSFFFFFNLFLYLFMAVLGLRFCARAFSSCGERGPLFIAVRRPLTMVASLVVEHRLQMRRLSSCGSRAQLLRGMWDLPRPGLEPVSLHWQADSQPLRHQGSPCCYSYSLQSLSLTATRRIFKRIHIRSCHYPAKNLPIASFWIWNKIWIPHMACQASVGLCLFLSIWHHLAWCSLYSCTGASFLQLIFPHLAFAPLLPEQSFLIFAWLL